MEEALCDIPALRQFWQFNNDLIAVEFISLGFRHLMEAHDPTEHVFQLMEQYLGEQRLILSEATIVDSSTVAATPSAKNKDKTRDTNMKQTEKGNQWNFRMKMQACPAMPNPPMQIVECPRYTEFLLPGGGGMGEEIAAGCKAIIFSRSKNLQRKERFRARKD